MIMMLGTQGTGDAREVALEERRVLAVEGLVVVALVVKRPTDGQPLAPQSIRVPTLAMCTKNEQLTEQLTSGRCLLRTGRPESWLLGQGVSRCWLSFCGGVGAVRCSGPDTAGQQAAAALCSTWSVFTEQLLGIEHASHNLIH